VADRGWKRKFDDSIPLPRGRQLITLQDAGEFITKLPKIEHEAAEWQAAMPAPRQATSDPGQNAISRRLIASPSLGSRQIWP
jgi:hypothetical protein